MAAFTKILPGKRQESSQGFNNVKVASAHSEIGGRKSQQDAALAMHSPDASKVFLAVCDGVGGENHGGKASTAAINHFVEDADAIFKSNSSAQLASHIRDADRKVLETRGKTTAVTALVKGSSAMVAHAGDSVALLVRKGSAKLLTQPHGQGRYLESGLGMSLKIDRSFLTLQPGDKLVLCSDGVGKMLKQQEIAGITNAAQNPHAAAKELVQKALEKGGRDNATAVVYFHKQNF